MLGRVTLLVLLGLAPFAPARGSDRLELANTIDGPVSAAVARASDPRLSGSPRSRYAVIGNAQVSRAWEFRARWQVLDVDAVAIGLVVGF